MNILLSVNSRLGNTIPIDFVSLSAADTTENRLTFNPFDECPSVHDAYHSVINSGNNDISYYDDCVIEDNSWYVEDLKTVMLPSGKHIIHGIVCYFDAVNGNVIIDTDSVIEFWTVINRIFCHCMDSDYLHNHTTKDGKDIMFDPDYIEESGEPEDYLDYEPEHWGVC